MGQLEYRLINSVFEFQKSMHLQWLVLTKLKHQIILNKPIIVRRIYTKAWDDHIYPNLRFPGIKILEDPVEASTSGSRELH